jgi:hypothetical protein
MNIMYVCGAYVYVHVCLHLYRYMQVNNELSLHLYILTGIQSRVWVTVDGVRIGNWIY